MDNKKQLEKELVNFLIGYIPVPWIEIVYHAQCDGTMWAYFYAFREEATNMVITLDSFYNRYDRYNYDKMDAKSRLMDYARIFYDNCPELSETVNGYELVCKMNKDGGYKFDYIHISSDRHEQLSREIILEKYLGSEYYFVPEKFPSTKYILYS